MFVAESLDAARSLHRLDRACVDVIYRCKAGTGMLRLRFTSLKDVPLQRRKTFVLSSDEAIGSEARAAYLQVKTST